MEPRSIAKAIHENVHTIAEVRDAHRQSVGRHQRAVEAASRLLGRPSTVYGLLGVAAFWILYNLSAAHLGARVLDAPPFYWLQGATGLFDALIAATVLTAQSRQNREAEQRAHLALQVNLLAEQKATKIIALLEELRRDIPIVRNRYDSEAEALQQAVDPKAVLSAIESTTPGEVDPPQQDGEK
jgi:uncharacterized membrane protein